MKTVMGFNPEVLRETDFKGAFGCFAMLTWALVMTGRLAYVGTLYTSALTGVVVQYALLQARARYSPDPQSDDEQARESEPSECNLDPCSVSQRGGGKYSSYYAGSGRTALDGGCGRCCDLQTTCARGQGKRNNVLAEIMSSGCSQQSEQWKPPCLSEVTAALAFCSLPLSVCAIVAQFLVDSVSPLMAPLPAAWCTLLAVCALLPPDRRQMDRPFVIVPTGVMFTWLSLIFIV